MTRLELPAVWRSGEDLQDIIIEAYEDRFSANWNSNILFSEFVVISRERTPGHKEVMLEGKEDSVEGEIDEIEEAQIDDAEFFVVYGSDHSLRWKRTSNEEYQSKIGVAAKEPNTDLIELVYSDTERKKLPPEVVEDIDDFLGDHVDS
ncbi:hypothetical protein [Halorubrum sp. Hd13]|uniref:hypothetical protein n=1 Tax=Halorubrum sp. Hd13 TaxID=1480728 RepID=UPI00113FC9B6|nr:hypothetical protein [Halorubrum sp. Hd13]